MTYRDGVQVPRQRLDVVDIEVVRPPPVEEMVPLLAAHPPRQLLGQRRQRLRGSPGARRVLVTDGGNERVLDRSRDQPKD